MEEDARSDRRRELFWYYKAGFNAAHLLEEDSKWESAAAIYEKLAAAGGSRSEEAKARLTNLRLEHFLWTDWNSSWLMLSDFCLKMTVNNLARNSPLHDN
jgi:hypothetical protein